MANSFYTLYIFMIISLGNFFFFDSTVLGPALVPTANLSTEYTSVSCHLPCMECGTSYLVTLCLYIVLLCFTRVPNEGEHFFIYFTGQLCFFLFELFSPTLFAYFSIAMFIYFTNSGNLSMMLARLSSISVMQVILFSLTLKK